MTLAAVTNGPREDPGPLMLWWFGQGSLFHSVSGNGQYKRMPILLTIQTTDHCSKHSDCFMHIYLCNYQLKIICTDHCSNHSEHAYIFGLKNIYIFTDHSKRFRHKYLCNYQNKKIYVLTDTHREEAPKYYLEHVLSVAWFLSVCERAMNGERKISVPGNR